jgi:hypothetical protein
MNAGSKNFKVSSSILACKLPTLDDENRERKREREIRTDYESGQQATGYFL